MYGVLLDTVFLAGNFEAQRLSRLPSERQCYLYVKRHFIFSCLLSERVFFPAANYFQSKITQRLTDDFAPLFRYSDRYPQIVFVAINPSKENFRGEALEKKDTYLELPDYDGYMNSVSREHLVKRLNSITQPYMRYGKLVDSLGDYIQNETKDNGILFQLINKYVGSEVWTRRIFEPLVTAVEKREKAIIPEYIISQDANKSIDKHSERLMRLSLLKAYSSSLEQLYASYVNNPLIQTYDAEYLFPYSVHFLDTILFDIFLRLFSETYYDIHRINAKQLNELKFSERFIIFKKYYIEFVEKLSINKPEFSQIPYILESEKAQQVVHYKQTLSEIVKNSALAILLYKSMANAIPTLKRMFGQKIKKSTELFSNYDTFFAYALVNEVSESFRNQYETLLDSSLCSAYKKQERRFIMIIGKNNINNGGIQVVDSTVKDSAFSSGIAINAKEIPVPVSLSEIEIKSLSQFADAIISIECIDFTMSKKHELAGLIHSIVEKSDFGKKNIDDASISPFKKTYGMLSKVAKEAIVKIAAGILAPVVIKLLGL